MSSVSDSCEWHIPISIATSDKPGEAAVKTLLEKKSCSVLMNGVQPDQWLKVSTIRLLCSEIDWERKSKRKTSCPSSVANLLPCWQLVFALTVGESRASWILPCSLQFRYAGASSTGHQWPQVTSSRSSGTWKWPLCPGKLANQYPKSTIKQKWPHTFAQLANFSKTCLPWLIIIQSCYFYYRINKPFACSRCVICVSCAFHLILTYYARKGSWTFYLNCPQINAVGKSDHMDVYFTEIFFPFTKSSLSCPNSTPVSRGKPFLISSCPSWAYGFILIGTSNLLQICSLHYAVHWPVSLWCIRLARAWCRLRTC